MSCFVFLRKHVAQGLCSWKTNLKNKLMYADPLSQPVIDANSQETEQTDK